MLVGVHYLQSFVLMENPVIASGFCLLCVHYPFEKKKLHSSLLVQYLIVTITDLMRGYMIL